MSTSLWGELIAGRDGGGMESKKKQLIALNVTNNRIRINVEFPLICIYCLY